MPKSHKHLPSVRFDSLGKVGLAMAIWGWTFATQAASATHPVFTQAASTCSEDMGLWKAVPKLSAYSEYTLHSADCIFFKTRIKDKDLSAGSIGVEYRNGERKMVLTIMQDRTPAQQEYQKHIKDFNRKRKPDHFAVSELKTLDHAFATFGKVDSPEFSDTMNYAQYRGIYRNRYGFVIDVYGPELRSGSDVDHFLKAYLEAFNLGELR